MNKCDSCNKSMKEELMGWYGDAIFCSVKCFDDWVFTNKKRGNNEK